MDPPEPPKSPKRATRKLSEILLSTEVGVNLGITGPLPTNTFRSVERLADAFGFGSTDAFKSWFDSPAFQLFYNELQTHIKQYEDPSQPPRQGPTFAAVEKATYQGERNGLMRYSSVYNLNVSDFVEVDWYALCLVRMSQYNQRSRDGAFFGKKMSQSDIHCRLWQAILRTNYNLAPSRQVRSKKTTLSTDLQNSTIKGSSQGTRPSEGNSQQPSGGGSSQDPNPGEGNSQQPSGSGNGELDKKS